MVTYFVSGRSPAVRRAYMTCEIAGQIGISTITQAEILFGLAKKPEAMRLRSLFEEFFTTVQIMPWDTDAARSYGTLRAQLSRTGKTLAVMDLLIASHALSVGATLVTHDQAFRYAAPMLPVVDWATDL